MATALKVASLVEAVLQRMALFGLKLVFLLLMTGILTAGGLEVPAEPPPNPQAAPALGKKAAAPARQHADLYGDPLPEEASLRLGTLRFRSPHIRYLAYTPDQRFLIGSGQ